MNFILYKYSSPGFTKKFHTLEELTKELYSHVCSECLEDGKELSTMLRSSCGCEFGMEDPIENPPTQLELLEFETNWDSEKSIKFNK
jgi:hypothetical protein